MEKRKLGKSGLEVSAIGLGCMGDELWVGSGERQTGNDFADSIRRRKGVTFFDTAEVYGPFDSKKILARSMWN